MAPGSWNSPPTSVPAFLRRTGTIGWTLRYPSPQNTWKKVGGGQFVVSFVREGVGGAGRENGERRGRKGGTTCSPDVVVLRSGQSETDRRGIGWSRIEEVARRWSGKKREREKKVPSAQSGRGPTRRRSHLHVLERNRARVRVDEADSRYGERVQRHSCGGEVSEVSRCRGRKSKLTLGSRVGLEAFDGV